MVEGCWEDVENIFYDRIDSLIEENVEIPPNKEEEEFRKEVKGYMLAMIEDWIFDSKVLYSFRLKFLRWVGDRYPEYLKE